MITFDFFFKAITYIFPLDLFVYLLIYSLLLLRIQENCCYLECVFLYTVYVSQRAECECVIPAVVALLVTASP